MPKGKKKTHHADATPVVAFCQGPDWKPRSSTKEPGTCGACGADLVGRNHWFCKSPAGQADTDGPPTTCRDRYAQNHFWGDARRAAIRRDGNACRRCGGEAEKREHYLGSWERPLSRVLVAAEVNHIEPRNGGGYAPGCHNHQDNLETLCHRCHVATTKEQVRERKRARSPQIGMEVQDEEPHQDVPEQGVGDAAVLLPTASLQREQPKQGVAHGARGSAATAAAVDALRAWLLAPDRGVAHR